MAKLRKAILEDQWWKFHNVCNIVCSMECASEFCRMNSTRSTLQQNLCQGRWTMIKRNTAFLSALSWRSRPKKTPTLFPPSLQVKNVGCLGTTLRQSSRCLSGRLLLHCWRKHKFEAMSNWCWFVFFDNEGIVHKELVPPGQTMNGKFYCDILRWMGENIQCKHPEKWRNSWALHHDNTLAHASFLVQQFLGFYDDSHPPPSLLTRPHPLWLFPILKMKLKLMEWHFDSSEEIQNELQDMIKALMQNDFQQCFWSWKSHWDRCINAEGNYFEGDGGKHNFQSVVKLWQRNCGNFWVAPRTWGVSKTYLQVAKIRY